MNDIWQGIAAGLGAGLQQMGGMMMQQHFSEQAQQDRLDQQKLAAELKQQAEQAAAEATKQREIFVQSIKPPTVQSYKMTDSDGNVIQKTNSLKFNPTTMQYDTTELGSAPLMGQYSLGQQTQGDDQQSVLVNHATGKVTPTGTAGPRYGVHRDPDNSDSRPKPIRSADMSQILRGVDDGSRRRVYQWLNNNPNASAGQVAGMIQKNDFGAPLDGDSDENRKGTIQIDPAMQAKLDNASRSAPAAGGANPSQRYPDGTKLKGPDGRIYIVRNGQPVLVQ